MTTGNNTGSLNTASSASDATPAAAAPSGAAPRGGAIARMKSMFLSTASQPATTTADELATAAFGAGDERNREEGERWRWVLDCAQGPLLGLGPLCRVIEGLPLDGPAQERALLCVGVASQVRTSSFKRSYNVRRYRSTPIKLYGNLKSSTHASNLSECFLFSPQVLLHHFTWLLTCAPTATEAALLKLVEIEASLFVATRYYKF